MGILIGVFAVIGVIVGAVVVAAAFAVWRAYVMTVLWSWFVIPMFGLQPLTIAVAFGLCLFVALFSRRTNSDEENEKMKSWQYWAVNAVSPLAILGLGWIAKQFM